VPVRNPQIPTYDTCLEDHRHHARWLAFIDVDEFLHPADDAQVLRDVLEKYHDFGGVVVPWTLMGSSHHVAAPSGLVIENYLHRRTLAECNGDTCAYKVIVQGEHTDRCDVHHHYYADLFFIRITHCVYILLTSYFLLLTSYFLLLTSYFLLLRIIQVRRAQPLLRRRVLRCQRGRAAAAR